MTGAFFTFDGIDGTGKSTQAELFCRWLGELGKTVVRCRDPGSTELGEQLRGILLGISQLAIAKRSETLLYMAARAQLVDEIIKPALDSGSTVVSDRFLLANIVYQAYGWGLNVEEVRELGRFATGGLAPSMTFVMDMEIQAAAARLDGPTDRMERREMAYFQRVREGFLAEARRQPESIVVIHADQPVERVQADIRAAVRERFASF
jgi:dTMP kinase